MYRRRGNDSFPGIWVPGWLSALGCLCNERDDKIFVMRKGFLSLHWLLSCPWDLIASSCALGVVLEESAQSEVWMVLTYRTSGSRSDSQVRDSARQ